MNGMTTPNSGQAAKKCTSYKLLTDPAIKKGCQKLYRYDGIVPGHMGQQLSVKFVNDPRSRLTRLWRDVDVADLPIPKMKFDEYFVGELPPKQITFTNLNDNVREPFLRSMAEKHGKIEDITIHRHPKTSKHLGLASVTYTSTRSAKQAAIEMNRTSVMGKIIIVQIDPGGKECQRIFDCLANDKPNTPSSIGSTPHDPRNGTPASSTLTPRPTNDPRRLSLERVPDTPSSSISSATPGYLAAENHGAFQYPEQAAPAYPAAAVANPAAAQFQMPDQMVQPDMLAHSMNSVTLQQQYQQMQQQMYAAAGHQGAYPVPPPDVVSHVPPPPDMYTQPAPVPMSEGFAMPQNPPVQGVPDQQAIYGHQQQLPVANQDFLVAQNIAAAMTNEVSQHFQAQPADLHLQQTQQQTQQFQSHVDPQTFPQAHAQTYQASDDKSHQSQTHGQQSHAQSSKKDTYVPRGEAYHSKRDDANDAYQSRSYQSHSGKSHRHSDQLSGSKRFDDDRGKSRHDFEDRGKSRHDFDYDRSKKWDRKDRQDYHTEKRVERRRYKSQDHSDDEDSKDGGSFHRKDYRQSRGSSNYKSRDSDRGVKNRYDDPYHGRSRRGYDDDSKDHESGRGSRYGSKSKGNDRKYDSRTRRDDYQDRKKKWDSEESVDHFEKWRCPTGMEETVAKVKEENYEFDAWKCPPVETKPSSSSKPVAKPEKFEKWRPPTSTMTSIAAAEAVSPDEESPLQDWEFPPGEEPPPGTMPLVLPSEPMPPGTQDETEEDKASGSGDDAPADDLDLSLDTRIEKLLKSSQGPMAFAGLELQDSSNAGKNSSTSANTLQPPGTEEPAFSQSEESVGTSEPEEIANYGGQGDRWNIARQELQRLANKGDNQWPLPPQVPHPSSTDMLPHPRLEMLKGGSNGTEPYHTPRSSSPTPPGSHSGSVTPSVERKVPQAVEMLISNQLANLRNYDQQISSRGTSPVSDLIRNRSQTSTPGIEDRYSYHQSPSVHATPMDTGADDMEDDDDKMSLSSLSSGEDTKIVVNAPVPQKKPQSPRGNSTPYSVPPTSWNSNLNQRSTNVVNAWAAQMMPQTVPGASQQQLSNQPSTSSGLRPNAMFPRGPPPSFPGMPQSGLSLPPRGLENFFASVPPPQGSSSSAKPSMPTTAQLMQMMSSLGGFPGASLGQDGKPDLKTVEQLLKTPPRWNAGIPSSPAFEPILPAGASSTNLPPWASMPYMPPFQDNLYPSPEKPQRDPEKELVNEVLKTVIHETKFIMIKDLNRKMVESKAFKALEKWWDTCQMMAKAKEEMEMKPKEEEKKTPKKPPPAIPSLLDSSWSSSFSMDGMGLGLGLRANMPRMPSFKVKRKPPSPLPEDEKGEDEPESDEEERAVTPPVLDEDSDEVSETEPDETTEVSSQTSEQHILAKREQAKRARDLIYTSSSEEDDDDENEAKLDQDEDEEEKLDEEEEEDEEEDEEEEDDDEEDEDDEDEEDEEEDLDELADELEGLEEEAAEILKQMSPQKVSPIKEEPLKMEVEEEKRAKDKADVVEPTKAKGKKVQPELSDEEEDEEEGEEDEDWSGSDESSSSSEAESSSSDVDSSESDDEQEEDEEKSAVEDTKEETSDRLGAFDILVEMATKAKDKLDQSSSDAEGNKKGIPEDLEMSDIQAAESLQALRMHASAGDSSEVGEMTALKRDTSATVDSSSEKTLSGSEGEPDVDVGDYKSLLLRKPVVVLEQMATLDHTYALKRPATPVQEQPAAADELKKVSSPEAILAEKTNRLVTTLAEKKEEKRKQKEEEKEKKKEEKEKKKEEKKKARKRKNELAQILEEEIVIVPEPKVPEFAPRNYYEEWQMLYEFLATGISHEDAYLIRKSYETLLEAGRIPWLSYTHWVPHSLTCTPTPPQPKKRKTGEEETREHLSGSSRTEGYYKISNKEKVKYLTKARTYVQESVTDNSTLDESITKKRFEVSRDARSDQRRFIATLQQQEGPVSELLKFNQLQFRKKDLKFCKSSIHGWGLYAMEPIAADEMVIEYVGESVRQSMADKREKNYERMGIGSSYLFRIDALTIIDATKTGNLARFINHSCNPNCYAKIITVESQKKIVIYSKQTINVGDEITYDYKFPIEDEKIPCLCGNSQCRGTLN